MHGKTTTNKRGLEACKAKDKKGNLVIDRQRNIMIKIKKDCHFEYLLFYKIISKGSSKKKYIKDNININVRMIKYKIIQIIFFYKKIICFIQRFIADKLFIINDIFNINKLRLDLLINIDIINNNKIFFYTSSYYLDETIKF